MIQREAKNEIRVLASQFKAVAVVGPRQSGKTTLVRLIFKDKTDVNFENPDVCLFTIEDLRGFSNGTVLDEAQRVPQLFSYLQEILGESTTNVPYTTVNTPNYEIV